MRLLRIRIEGFRSFVQPTDLTFPDRAGLFLMRGENHVMPALGGNGAGKSTFWDAVSWILWGKTARRLSAGQVESWQPSESCGGLLELEVDGIKRTIERGRNPIRLLVDGEPRDQEGVDDLLGIGFERGQHVILMGQFGTLFPDLKPAERLSLISEVLKLDEWTDLAEHAAAEVRGLEVEREGLERRLHGCQERARTLDENLARAIEAQQRWHREHEERLHAAFEKYKEAPQAQAGLPEQIANLEEQIAALKDKGEEIERYFGELEKERRMKQQEAARADGEMAGMMRDVQRTKNLRDKLLSLDGKVCPECGQEVDSKHLSGVYESARDTYSKATSILKAAEEKKLALGVEAKRVNRLIDSHNLNEQQHTAELQHVKDKLNSKRRALDEQRAQEERARVELERIEKEISPHNELIRRTEVDVDKCASDTEEAEVVLYDTQTQLDLLDYWPKGCKEIRLWLVDKALAELTIHANSSLIELGLEGWKIEFIVERETKSGTIARGFEVTVTSPDSPDGVPWEAWSGGETQRLRIACAIGLANLIRDRMPSTPMVEVWDEPTAHINPEGLEDLVEFFSERANDRQVWLVDHRVLDAGSFDQVVTIVKDETGSHIE